MKALCNIATAREIDVRGSRRHNDKYPKVIDYFNDLKPEVADMITHRFPFTEVHESFALIENPEEHNGNAVLTF